MHHYIGLMLNTVITPEGDQGQLRLGLCGHARASVVTVDRVHRVYVEGRLYRVRTRLDQAVRDARASAGVRRTGETLH